MKRKTQGSREAYLYRVLCIMAGVVALFPVSYNHIMSGGIVTEWIARMEELAAGLRAGQLYFYPSAEVFRDTGIRVNGMNSNFWFIIPSILYLLSGNMVLTYRVYMLAVQAATLVGAILLFQRLFAAEETKLPAFFSTLLYMTCPYRIYICYDLANISQATAWMLMPFYAWAVVGLMKENNGLMKEDKRHKFGKADLLHFLIAVLALAGIGYADVVLFLIAVGITALVSLALRMWLLFGLLAAGGACFLPGLYRLMRYLFMGAYAELEMPLKSIMGDGYRFGEYFSSYSFRNGHPGMGMGMLICLLAGAWLGFAENGDSLPEPVGGKCGKGRFFVIMSILMTLLSLRRFPWDFVQRLGVWALKLVSLMDTPAVFWGVGFLCLCVPAGYAMNRINRIGRHEEREAALAVPVMVMLFCVGICVYQCNTLTYNRPPLIVP